MSIFSDDGGFVASTSINLITNTSFETDTTGWGLAATFTRSSADAYDGTYSIKQDTPSDYDNFVTEGPASAGITVAANTRYTLKFWKKVTVNSGNAPRLQLNKTTAFDGEILLQAIAAAANWTLETVNFTTAVGQTELWIRIFNYGGDVDAYYDNFSLSLTVPEAPTTPSITSPSANATGVAVDLTVTSSSFAGGSGTHAHTQYQIATDSGFSTVVYDSGELGAVESVAVSPDLSNSTEYYVRVRYQNSDDLWSSYSAGVHFTTASASQSLIGYTSTANSYGGLINNYIIGSKYTATASGDMVTFKFHLQGSSTVDVGIYSDNAGNPNAKLNHVYGVSGSAGWNSVVFPSTAITQGTAYWLCITTATNVTATGDTDSGNNGFYKAQAQGSMPATMSGQSMFACRLALEGWS